MSLKLKSHRHERRVAEMDDDVACGVAGLRTFEIEHARD